MLFIRYCDGFASSVQNSRQKKQILHKKFYPNPPMSYTKTVEFGRVERKPTSSQVVFLLSAKSLRSMSWYRLVCVFRWQGRLHFVEEKAEVDCAYYVITLATCFQILSTTAIPCCPPDSSFSKTVRQHTQRAAHRTGCGPTVQIFLQRTSGLQIRRI